MINAALIDTDGTLSDNNLLHVLAWQRAFRRAGYEIDSNTIVHHIGMGSDKLPAAVLGVRADDAGDRLSDYHSAEYREKGLIAHAERLPGADALLTARKDRGARIVLASQARPKEMDHFLK